jgi:ankyrin repeat protein
VVIREFLNHSTSVNFVNNVGYMPLHLASKEGHLEVVRELPNHDAQVDFTRLRTSLHSSSKRPRGGCLTIAESWS